MADSLAQVFARMQRWTVAAQTCDVADAVLVERYLQRREEAAFAALVARHGTMVLRLCRRILGDAHAAEDAFQATFLILASKARSLKQPDALPAWLYGVARRVALKARRQSSGRAAALLDETLADPHADPLMQLTAREVLDILDEEVRRLPASQRSAFVLCCLEGHTQDEAARILGCTAGSIKGLLERGRQRLQRRLTRRGITLSAALALLAAARDQVSARLSARLCQSTVRAVLDGGLGNSTALAHGVLKSMLMGKLAGMMGVVLTVVLAASATVVLVYRTPGAEAPEHKTPAVPAARKNAEPSRPPIRRDVWGDPLPPRAVARLGSLRLYHGQWVHRITLSPDGKWVVSSAQDGNRMWDAATGRELTLRAELRQAAIFATRDKLVAVAQQNLDLQLWDMASAKKIGGLLPAAKLGQLWAAIHLGFPDGYALFALAPDERTLVVCNLGEVGASVQRVLRFCDVVKGKVEDPVALELDNGSQTRMTFSADSKTLVVQCNDATIHVWDVDRRKKKLRSQPNQKDFGGQMALSPDGKILATAPFAGKRVHLWDSRTLKELPPLLKQPQEFIRMVAFSPDGKQLASINANSPTVRLWDLATRKETRQFQSKEQQIFHAVFSADGKFLAIGDGNGVTLWNTATGKRRHDFGHSYMIDSIHFSPDGRRLLSGAAYTDNIARIWDPLIGKETAQLRGHKAGIEAVAYAPDGKLAATASQDGTVRLWDSATGREVRRMEAKDGMVYAMAFAPDGKTLASGGRRKAVHLWDVATGRERRTFGNPGEMTLRLAFSPDGKMLATRRFQEKDIQLWDVAKGEAIRRLAGPRAGCPSLAFSSDGKMLAAGGEDATVHFWDVRSGEKLPPFAIPLETGEAKRVLSIALSPDGRSLAVGYGEGDCTIRLWEMCSGRERLRFEGHRGGIGCLVFSADGALLASGGTDRIIVVWDVSGQRTTHLLHKGRFRPEEGNALWSALADADACKAYLAMQTLLAAGSQAVSIFKNRLRPAAATDERRIDRLITDLDSNRFEVREKAAQELRRMGGDVEPALRKTLASKPSAEQRLRLKQLLHDIEATRSPEHLRLVRSVETLEWIGTAEAQQVLKSLAEGGSQASLTREAKAALQRLANKRR